jgi:predicted nucleotidyltransferase
MDLRHPLRSLVPSLDWAVLEVLAGTESGLSASQIARLSADGSRSGQAAILDRLAKQGLVIAEPANQGFLYRLNRDHLLASAVVSTAGIRARLIDLLREEAAELCPAVVHASVFGSFARGAAGEESDIDLLLIAATDQDIVAWEGQLDLLQERVRRCTGNRCTCTAFSVERMRQLDVSGEPIVDNWVADELLLIGRTIGQLLERSGRRAVTTARSQR